MNRLFVPAVTSLMVAGAIIAIAFNKPAISQTQSGSNVSRISHTDPPKPAPRKIQVAVLLDVSNSMDGLIEQAKAQLWNMVSVLGRATCDGVAPSIEIALYEYGRPANNISTGYIKRINSFTSNLDQVSENLFRLTTNGGEEFCGQVIHKSLTDLEWDASSSNYKVIFIAGNEDFHQGRVSFTKACALASEKGVIVNTIYCGDRSEGIREHWNLGAECGNGSFTVINQNAKIDDIATPYDDRLFELNEQLNKTYVSYGEAGAANYEKQASVDKMNYSSNKAAAAKRVSVKGKKELYNNAQWDLVDAYAADSTIVTKVDVNTLPAELKGKSRVEINTYVKQKTTQRTQLQKEIATISVKRDSFIATEKAKAATGTKQQTLETEVEKILKVQAKRFKMVIE